MTKRLFFSFPIFIFFVLCFGLTATARIVRIGDQEYIERVWRTDDGLPQNSVTSIVQTHDGYIWVGTFGGLARFDGIRFTLFNSGNTPGLTGNRIFSLYEDEAGALWIGFESGGMARYQNGKFISLTSKDGAPDGSYRISHRDRDGRLWFVSLVGDLNENRVNIYADGRFKTFTADDGLPGSVVALAEDRDGKIWVSTESGLYFYENERFRFAAQTVEPGIINKREAGGLWISSPHFIGSYEKGVFTPLNNANQTLPQFSVAWEADHRLWLLKEREKPRYLDSGKFSEADLHPIVRAILTDREGNLWIGGMGSGLACLRRKKLTTYTRVDGLPHDEISAITEDKNGVVWIAGFRLVEFRDGKLTTFENTQEVDTLYADTDGSLWFKNKANLVNLKDGKMTDYPEIRDPEATFRDSKGQLWLAANSAVGQLVDGKFVVVRSSDEAIARRVSFITEDRAGAIWFGSADGMFCYKDGQFTDYTVEQGLSNNYVRAIYEDAEGAIWAGTYGGGLNRFKDGKFTPITTRNGLFDDIVSRILVDDDDNFWMSGNRGIYRVSRQELNGFADGRIASVNSISYGKADGMVTEETNGPDSPAGWRTRDGRLWFPTIEGVVVIDPKETSSIKTPTVIEQILFDKQTLDLSDERIAPPGDGDLEIQYTGLSFIAPEKVRFRYKLEGSDENWIEAGTRRVAFYTKLPPGDYTFRVMSTNSNGEWNEADAAIRLTLKPHFYQTKLFYALCIIGLAAIGFTLYRLRVRGLRQRAFELETKVVERTSEVEAQKTQLAENNEKLDAFNRQMSRANDDMLSILNQLRLGVAIAEDGGAVTFLSQAAQNFLNVGEEEAVGANWTTLLPLSLEEKARIKFISALPPKQRSRVPVQLQVDDGRRYQMEIEVQDDPRESKRKIFYLYDVSEIYDLRRLLDEKAKFHELVGESTAMRIVFKQIHDVAQMETTVLVEGETGTGKELVARAIHYTSARKDKAFVAVNCAELSESLLASQLFGHKRGSFTGAVSDHTGLFESAAGGTLFLDEIGDMPLGIQASLLRVLQEKEITRLGETKPRKIDVRIIAATHRDLHRRVAEGFFREDLLYRIRVARIHLPPLRERIEDLSLLVSWFLGQFRAPSGKTDLEISSEAMEFLTEYRWTGNVRELRSAIEYAVINCRSAVIQPGDLPPEIVGTAHVEHIPSFATDSDSDEKQRLVYALEKAKGNRAAAARMLGISRPTLYSRLKMYGLVEK
jgi:transcriptional regulator with PAS, ATPase and Fis domain/ligand-binding sensor domain-containing protein